MSAPPQVVVLDTSVAAKWLLAHEEGAAAALQLREDYLAGKILIVLPELVLYELANVLQLQPELSPAAVGAFFDYLVDLGCPIVSLGARQLTRAVVLARQHGVSTYDATFIALAEEIGGDWVTADERALRMLPDDLPAVHLSRCQPRDDPGDASTSPEEPGTGASGDG